MLAIFWLLTSVIVLAFKHVGDVMKLPEVRSQMEYLYRAHVLGSPTQSSDLVETDSRFVVFWRREEW